MSYFTILGCEREPFSTSPDPRFFYESQQHKAALVNVLIELRLRRGLSVVLGDVGVGKTTLGRKLVQQLKERPGFDVHMILDPSYPSEESFLAALIRTFQIGIETPTPGVVELKASLERFLYRQGVEEGRTTVLVIDEAQKLNAVSLEVLRSLLNFETNEVKLLQLVLLAQLELMPLLAGAPNVLDRISWSAVLQPLTPQETHELIEFRLREAGYRGWQRLFTDEAIAEIHRTTQGSPRRISWLCHHALRTLVAVQGERIERELILELLHRGAGWPLPQLLGERAR